MVRWCVNVFAASDASLILMRYNGRNPQWRLKQLLLNFKQRHVVIFVIVWMKINFTWMWSFLLNKKVCCIKMTNFYTFYPQYSFVFIDTEITLHSKWHKANKEFRKTFSNNLSNRNLRRGAHFILDFWLNIHTQRTFRLLMIPFIAIILLHILPCIVTDDTTAAHSWNMDYSWPSRGLRITMKQLPIQCEVPLLKYC